MNKCLIYESLKPINEMKQSVVDGLMTLEGCFGVCAKKNRNNRIYERENYSQMIEGINERIKNEGCVMGELEHPQGLNLNLENVSHKITKISMNENGVINGTIQLLNTPKGKIAQEIINGGCPLYISSRACGNVDKNGHVKLENLVTYDLVGTPGFEEARMNLKENQQFECLTESLCIISESGACCGNGSKPHTKKKGEGSEEEEEEEEESLQVDGEVVAELRNEIKNLKEQLKDYSELQSKVDLVENSNSKLSDQLKAWVTNEYTPLVEKWIKENQVSNDNDNEPVDTQALKEELKQWVIKEYSKGVQKWMIEEYSPEIQKWLINEYSPEVEKWIKENVNSEEDRNTWFRESIAPLIQKWIIEEYSPEIQKWITEQYSPEIQKWITEQYSPEVEKWITEQYSPEVEKWIIDEFAPVVQNWITEELQPELESNMEARLQEKLEDHVNESLKNDKETKLQNINEMLNMLEGIDVKKPTYSDPISTNKNEPLFIQKMPDEFRPLYEMASDDVKEYINRKAQLYNFAGDQSIRNFWESVDFNKEVQMQNIYEGLNNVQDERERAIRAQFRKHRNW